MNAASNHFTYKGRHLREWLLLLVEEEPKRRLSASKAVMACCTGPKDLPIEQCEPWMLAFQTEVKVTLQQPDFPRYEFPRKLLSLALEQQAIIDRKQQRDARWHEKPHRRMLKNPSPQIIVKQIEKSIARLDREEKTAREKEVEVAKGIVVCIQYLVMGLGKELLPAAEELRKMLKHPSWDDDACGVIQRMGKAGVVFLPELMMGLSKADGHCTQAELLGALLNYAPELIPECFAQTQRENKVLRSHAAIALGFCGREAIRQFPKIETEARRHLRDPVNDESIGHWPVTKSCNDYEWHAWAWMLGETAVTKATVTEFLKVTKGGDKHRIGKAIDCLGRMGLDAKRVVPRLAELMDEFEEFHQNTPSQLRVTRALESFDAEAKAAIPALRRHIWMKAKTFSGRPLQEKEPDYTVIRLLGKLGPAAKSALPTLREIKAKLGNESPSLVEAIRRIEGE